VGGLERRIQDLERLYGEPLVNEALARERQEEVMERLGRIVRHEGGDPSAPLTEEDKEGLEELMAEIEAGREGQG
jgi:hypothetical protein